MKAYKGKFKKKSGEMREMIFSRIEDLPNGFVAVKISGDGTPRNYPEGMEVVFDLEADDFRTFNYKTAEFLEEIDVDGTPYYDF